MKNMFRSITVLGGCLALCCASARGQGFYLDANAGVSLADDVKLKQFITPLRGRELDLEPGPRLSVAGGYNFNEYLGAQLETGFINNEVDGSDGNFVLSHVPLLADIVVRCDRANSKWVPYLGIGAGGDITVISVDRVRAPSGSVVDGSGSDIVFAWQAFAGVRYKITERISVGGGWKFFSAQGATIDVEHARGDIKTGDADAHSFGVDVHVSF